MDPVRSIPLFYCKDNWLSLQTVTVNEVSVQVDLSISKELPEMATRHHFVTTNLSLLRGLLTKLGKDPAQGEQIRNLSVSGLRFLDEIQTELMFFCDVYCAVKSKDPSPDSHNEAYCRSILEEGC